MLGVDSGGKNPLVGQVVREIDIFDNALERSRISTTLRDPGGNARVGRRGRETKTEKDRAMITRST
eukprot:4855350-Pyramimonas_sp.AAC.1